MDINAINETMAGFKLGLLELGNKINNIQLKKEKLLHKIKKILIEEKEEDYTKQKGIYSSSEFCIKNIDFYNYYEDSIKISFTCGCGEKFDLVIPLDSNQECYLDKVELVRLELETMKKILAFGEYATEVIKTTTLED